MSTEGNKKYRKLRKSMYIFCMSARRLEINEKWRDVLYCLPI